MEGTDITFVLMPSSSNFSEAFIAISISEPEEYKQISASSISTKIYAQRADKLFYINFLLTGFKFCLDKAITLGVFND